MASFHTVIFALGMFPLCVQVWDLHSTRTGGFSLPRSKRRGFFWSPTPTGAAKFLVSSIPCLAKNARATDSKSLPACVLLTDPTRWKLLTSIALRPQELLPDLPQNFGCDLVGLGVSI